MKAKSSENKNVSNRMSFYNLRTLKYYTVFYNKFECVQRRLLRIIEYTFNIKCPSHDYNISVLCFLNLSALADHCHLIVFPFSKIHFLFNRLSFLLARTNIKVPIKNIHYNYYFTIPYCMTNYLRNEPLTRKITTSIFF